VGCVLFSLYQLLRRARPRRAHGSPCALALRFPAFSHPFVHRAKHLRRPHGSGRTSRGLSTKGSYASFPASAWTELHGGHKLARTGGRNIAVLAVPSQDLAPVDKKPSRSGRITALPN